MMEQNFFILSSFSFPSNLEYSMEIQKPYCSQCNNVIMSANSQEKNYLEKECNWLVCFDFDVKK
jgi:hypothetical protein